jgi:hypothetical protein
MFGRFTAFWMKQANPSGTESADDNGRDEADLCEDYAESDRHGDRHTFSLGKPAANGAGTRSARGTRPKGAIDHQEQSKR